jgi:hypothetical protein
MFDYLLQAFVLYSAVWAWCILVKSDQAHAVQILSYKVKGVEHKPACINFYTIQK